MTRWSDDPARRGGAAVVIPLSKTKLVFLVAGALGFVGLAAVLWLIGGTGSGIEAVMIRGLAIATAAFFGLCGWFGARKLCDPAPGLILDHEGIVDNSSMISVGRIRWHESTGIRFTTFSGQRFLTIDVEDPGRFQRRGGWLRRKVNEANVWLVGSSINISANSLRVSFEELRGQVSECYRIYGRGG